TKGLYKRALAGELPQFTGISDPYEPPDAAEVTLDTSTLDLRASVQRITSRLVELGYLREERGSVQDDV
ncbi:adenylyl-sulfate kinase, partial [Salmonella enterica subsp. enterica serovar Istanbul]|nr:adenylyl-sulfate kinase [Salmonella enterica subsp. enterica serovar Istanbul]